MASFTLDNTGFGPASGVDLTITNNTTTDVIFTNDTDSRLRGRVGLGNNLSINGQFLTHDLDIPAKGYVILPVRNTATTGSHTIGFNGTASSMQSSHRTVAQDGETFYFGLV